MPIYDENIRHTRGLEGLGRVEMEFFTARNMVTLNMFSLEFEMCKPNISRLLNVLTRDSSRIEKKIAKIKVDDRLIVVASDDCTH